MAKKKKTAKQTAKIAAKKTAKQTAKKVAKKVVKKAVEKSGKKTPGMTGSAYRMQLLTTPKTPSRPKLRPKKKETEPFKVGEKAVYPARGVGIIERIESKEISGNVMSCYILRLLDSDITIMVPTDNAHSAGLRRLIPASRVKKVYKVFEEQDIIIDTTTWNRRYREYMEKISTGSVFETAEVMRDLYVLKKTKTLSFGERQMLDKARTILIKELALAKNVKEETIESEIKEIFEK